MILTIQFGVFPPIFGNTHILPSGDEKYSLPPTKFENLQFTWGYLASSPSSRRWLEDHPRTCKYLGSAPFISHEVRPFGRETTRSLGDLLIMVINPVLAGIMLQVQVDHWVASLVFLWYGMVKTQAKILRRSGGSPTKTHLANAMYAMLI